MDLFIQCLKNISKKNKDVDECLRYVKMIHPWLQKNIIAGMIELFYSSVNTIQKEAILTIIEHLDPEQVNYALDDLLPVMVIMAADTSSDIRKKATDTIKTVFGYNKNRDLVPLMPVVIRALRELSFTNQAIHELAGCVFIQNIDAPTLAVIQPVLKRGLKSDANEIKRKSCVIVDNMCKLVEERSSIHCFARHILPLVKNIADNASNPDVRSMGARALKTMYEVYDENYRPTEEADVSHVLKEYGMEDDETCKMVCNLINTGIFDFTVWNTIIKEPDTCNKILERCMIEMTPKELYFQDTDEGEDLYRGTFSLAYGTLTLLRNANLHLKRNRFYGLLGPNNCGKTTLMRAIHNEQVEGFPKKDELRTVFVEHEIQEREIGEDENHYAILNTDLTGVEWIMDYCRFMGMEIDREEVEKKMSEIGFGTKYNDAKNCAADAYRPMTTYSGGWKMKMQLCAAKLLDADILMLDEPTGHLDVKNVKWLKDWLHSFLKKGGSIITTSHDTEFLNEMCSHIIDFQKRRLVMFKGKLEQFVEKYPEKKNYFILTENKTRFEFPEPGPLEGVKSMSKTLLRMTDCSYQYPSRDTPTIEHVSLECSRISRVGVIGPNGAGKSTAIKLLIGEISPTAGTIYKHPNMRIAYVAQHALHHIEKHLNMTPAQYIMWRFAGFEDKESVIMLNKRAETREITKFFLQNNQLFECVLPQDFKNAVEPESIHGRHDKTKEYEVKWKSLPYDEKSWVKKDDLIRMGASKLVEKFDEKIAAESGLFKRQLTTRSISEHLSKFGLSEEDSVHTLMRSLSGGQKIKVVIGASLWLSPHLVILDEPTNYLDRDSLGALTEAIRHFKGGVIIISHNREFTNAVCQERWIMEKGRLRREGESIEKLEEEKKEFLDAEDHVVDALGNVLKVEKKRSEKELKQEIKRLTKLIKGKNNSQEDLLDYEFRIEQLKEELGK